MLADPSFRELATLPLSTTVFRELYKGGYNSVGEVNGLTIEQISSICKVSRSEAISIKRTVKTYSFLRKDSELSSIKVPYGDLLKPHTALEMLEPDSKSPIPGCCRVEHVLTMSKRFDDLMGGGFPCGRITELCGQPGVGKTQFCLQSCLTVQIPQWCGGLSGEAVFIDTEGNFMPRRLRQMAEKLVGHLQNVIAPHLRQYIDGLSDDDEDAQEKLDCLEALSNLPTEDGLLSKVHYIRCTDYLQLLAAVRRLRDFCNCHPNVRLIVVDSVALPFRYEFEDIPKRNRLLAALSQSLLLIAGSQNAAVVMTNQITTRFGSGGIAVGGSGTLVPALGDSWGHICSVRVLLSKVDSLSVDPQRTVQLIKHPGRPPGTATYQVTGDGIRDCA